LLRGAVRTILVLEEPLPGGAMKKLLLVIGVVVAAVSLWSWRRAAPDDAGRSLVIDRVWIDHVPRSERETFHVFAAISERSIGVFRAASMWRGGFEGFRFEASGDELRMVFPQTGDRETVKVKAQRCREERMDFCLELDGASRGVKRYYSRKGWEIRGAHDLDALDRAVQARIAAATGE
jgi:hypothetical protein